MLTAEWNMDTAIRVAGEEGEARGEARGDKRGRTEERDEVLSLIRQGLSAAEIEEALMRKSAAERS